MIIQGLSQRTFSQLDKHSDELALQRVSDPVISGLENIFYFIKTDIPTLYKPQTSTSLNYSILTGAPLFNVISRHGVGFYTDDNKAGLHYYRQTLVQRKVCTMSCTGADPAQNLTGSIGNLRNFDRCKAARKIFRPARGVRGHAPLEKFENPTSHMG